jgi:beta-lactamase class A
MKYLVLFNLLIIHLCSYSQQIDKKLQKKIEKAIAGFNGDIGVYVKNLKKNKIATINADTIFPTASMIKVPILVGIMDKIQRNELSYHQLMEYKDSLLYEGEDILGSFKSGEKIAFKKVVMLMLTTSDNTASLWLQSLAGTGTRINEILDSIGFKYTRVNSRTPGREDYRTLYGWGQTTPREMASLFEKIYRGEIIGKEASETMLRALKRNYWDGEALSFLPPWVNTFSKNGAVDRSRSETILVNAPHGDFVFSIITKNQKDESWGMHNEGWDLERKIALIIWQHYERKSKWKPMEKEPEKWF